ncbi:MAG: hypothetical protein LQ342_003254 [Letrouitia transgressa]|nr:MAG: hypothetical protein LQ342_003254 [Letrouitia transgressa]
MSPFFPVQSHLSLPYTPTLGLIQICEKLVDRGWRRSGTFYYKQDCRNSCCPHYAIRLDAKAFESRKDQRQAVNRWNRFILGEDYRFQAAKSYPKTRDWHYVYHVLNLGFLLHREKRRCKSYFAVCKAVHESEYSFVKKPFDSKTKQVIEPAHTFEVSLEPDSFTEEKWVCQFSISIFPDECEEERDGRQQKFGSYHQCYRLNKRLIAIGVLDLLPECVSSVYFIYHEDVQDWKLGKLGVLREIALAIEGGYRHYYMGFYIHSCTKMRYKGQYRPSYILDPETYDWNLFDEDFIKRLSARKYVSMKQERQLNLPAGLLTDIEEAEMESDKREALREYLSEADAPLEGALGSVFENRMPGVLSLEEVRRDIDLGQWRAKLRGDRIVRLKVVYLVFWEDEDMADPGTLKSIIAQFGAALGPSLVRQLVLDLT